jgi:hypothetical protein
MIRYEAQFGPVDGLFMSRHIKGWQIVCHPDNAAPYQVALCTNRISAGIIAAALQHACETGLTVKFPPPEAALYVTEEISLPTIIRPPARL